MAVKKNPFQKNKFEIKYNLINCLIAFLIAFLSSVVAVGEINFRVVCISVLSSSLVAIVKFSQYWEKQKPEYTNRTYLKSVLFNFI